MEFKGMQLMRTVFLSMILILLWVAGAAAGEATATPAEEPGATSTQKLEPITVVDKPVSRRQDLDPDSLVNPYRVDANIKRDFKLRRLLLTVALFGRNLGDDNYATRYVTGYYPDRGRTIGTEFTLAF